MNLSLWISPHDPFPTVASVVAAAGSVHLPGLTTRVLLPTAYGMYLQGAPGMNRSIGNELAPNSLEGISAVRSAIESQGFKCDGWAVPRGIEDPHAEGYLHGQIAALFDEFILNFEEWTSTENNPAEQFWTHPTNADAVNAYIGGFWQALADAGRDQALSGHVGLTWVTNSMLTNASDAVKLAFIGGTNYDCLEAYIPGDRSLDPGNARTIWAATLSRLGVNDRRFADILEQGDLPSLAQQYCDDVQGVQVWTLATATQQTWPDVAGEDPQVIAELQAQVAQLQQQLADMTGSRDNLQGIDNDLGNQLNNCQQLKAQVESTLNAEVADLNNQLKAAQDKATSDEAALQQRIDALVGERDKAIERSNALDAQVNQLQAQVTQLQNQDGQGVAALQLLAALKSDLQKVLA